MTHLLIDGPYDPDLARGDLWRGSSNQRLIFLTDRYRDLAEKLQVGRGTIMDVQLDTEGNLVILGIPPRGFWESLTSRLAESSSLEQVHQGLPRSRSEGAEGQNAKRGVRVADSLPHVSLS